MKRYLYYLPLLALLLVVGAHSSFADTTSSSSSNFVNLTALPGISSISTSSSSGSYTTLFNSLYRICIGIAAALALIEIIIAGITWMTAGDSSEQVSQARQRIGNAVLGLILVLSPVVVFGVINPNVLSLNLNVSSLTPSTASSGSGTAASSGVSSAVDSNAAAGTANAACTKNTDCNDSLVCNAATGACMTDSTSAYSCADDSAVNSQGLCANGQAPVNINGDTAPASGSVQASGSCAGNENACTNGYICDNTTSTCQAIPQDGAVGSGGSCAGNVNACDVNLTCDNNTYTCVAASASDTGGTSQTYVCPDGTQVDNQSLCSS
ncbi:MAG: pilin [Candidatus Pacebacteria bacterium]|nr:pilin [Candidatus Paceibacterota bacterium]